MDANAFSNLFDQMSSAVSLCMAELPAAATKARKVGIGFDAPGLARALIELVAYQGVSWGTNNINGRLRTIVASSKIHQVQHQIEKAVASLPDAPAQEYFQQFLVLVTKISVTIKSASRKEYELAEASRS